MRFENFAQLNFAVELKKLFIGSELIACSLMRIVIISSRFMFRVSSVVLNAMFSQHKLHLSISPGKAREVDSWQSIGEMRAQLISLH